MSGPTGERITLDFLGGVQQEELRDLKERLEKSAGDLTDDDLHQLLSARDQLKASATQLASLATMVRGLLRSLDERLGAVEAATSRSQSAENLRTRVESFEAIAKLMGSLSEMEQSVLQVATRGTRPGPIAQMPTDREAARASVSHEEDGRPTEDATAELGVSLESGDPGQTAPDETPSVAGNVFDAALDRMRRGIQ